MRTEALALGAGLKERVQAHLLFDDRKSFERTALVFLGLGLGASTLANGWTRAPSCVAALLLAEAAILFAPQVRGRPAVSVLPVRFVLAVIGPALAALGEPALGAVVAAALFGVTITRDATARLKLLAPLATGATMAWALTVTQLYDRWVLTSVSPLSRLAFVGASLGLLSAMGTLAAHLKWVDPVEGKLFGLSGTLQVRELYRRCRRALAAGEAPVLDRLLESVTLEAGQLSSQLETATLALGRLDRDEAEKELKRMRSLLLGADARSRAGLESAERSWSDALEHIDSMQSARSRLEANLLARTAWLERAAIGLETTPAVELGSLAQRLASQRPT